jgi:hypothetical protein
MKQDKPLNEVSNSKAYGTDVAEAQIAQEEWGRYREAVDLGHEKYMDRAKRCDEFYRGDQWEESDRTALDRQGKPALTINQILPTVNVLLGEQITRRADIRYKPSKDGKEEIACALTKTVNNIMDNNDYDSKESEVFADGIIEERGYFDVRMEFDDNMLGEIDIQVEDPCDVIPDPRGKKYDPSTWTEVTKTRWWSLDEIEREYGKEKRQRVESTAQHDGTFGQDSIKFDSTFASTDSDKNSLDWFSTGTTNFGGESEKHRVRSVRVLERQFYENSKLHLFVDPATGDTKVAPLTWNKEKRSSFAKQMGLYEHHRTQKRVKWRVCAGKVVLHDDWSPYRSFTIVPFFPYFRRGQTMGVVSNLLSPQEFLNKISSQELHIVNATANGGWITESGAISNMTTEELAANGAETGLVIEKAPGAPSPEKIQPNTIPTGLDRIGMKASIAIQEISGVTDAMLGTASAEVSGVALQSSEKRGQIQMQVPLDNLTRTRKLVAKKILELVQGFYTEPRVMKISKVLPMEGEEPYEELQVNMPTVEGEILNNLSCGKYDVVVASQPSRDSYNDTQFAEMISLKEIGIMIPDDRVIEYSNLQKKFALAEEVRSLTGRGEQSPEEAQMQAMQMQMEMQGQQLALAKAEGEVGKLQAETQKLMMESGAIPEELKLKLTELEMKAQMEREGFEVRARLAMESSQNALEKLALSSRGKQTEALLQATLPNTNNR